MAFQQSEQDLSAHIQTYERGKHTMPLVRLHFSANFLCESFDNFSFKAPCKLVWDCQLSAQVACEL